MRGRKPKPTKLKELAGNPGGRPLNSHEPQPPVPNRAPYVPRYLNEDGRKEWRRVVGILIDLGLYTVLDHTALAMYCQVYGRWVQIERELADEDLVLVGSEGGFYQNPKLHVANKAWEQMRKILAEFGLTPSSRSRLELKGGDEPSLAEQLFNMVNSK
jgi:P27 family predicted phage terminase small subunit